MNKKSAKETLKYCLLPKDLEKDGNSFTIAEFYADVLGLKGPGAVRAIQDAVLKEGFDNKEKLTSTIIYNIYGL